MGFCDSKSLAFAGGVRCAARCIDHVEQAPVSKKLVLRCVPARGDDSNREEIDLWESVAVLHQDGRIRRAIEVPRDRFLSLVRVEKLQVLFCDRARSLAVRVGIDDGDEWLGPDAARRVNNLEGIA